MKQRLFLIMLGLLAFALPSVAHHSPANFDLTVTEFAVQGKVKSVDFRNPHSEMILVTTEANGKTAEWDVEFSSVNLLVRRGWKMDRIKVGDTVTCIGNPGKDGQKKMYMWSIRLADGTEYKK